MSIKIASDPNIPTMQRQLQRIMEQMQKGFSNFCPSETWTPNVNLYETETTYIVCADLAGVDKNKIDVIVSAQKLTLRGARTVPIPPNSQAAASEGQPGKMRVHVMEIDHGPFSREVDLPADVAHEQISAAHLNGLLWIELPKKQDVAENQ